MEDARKENYTEMVPTQSRGIYSVETRAQSQIKSRPETIISINGAVPRDTHFLGMTIILVPQVMSQ